MFLTFNLCAFIEGPRTCYQDETSKFEVFCCLKSTYSSPVSWIFFAFAYRVQIQCTRWRSQGRNELSLQPQPHPSEYGPRPPMLNVWWRWASNNLLVRFIPMVPWCTNPNGMLLDWLCWDFSLAYHNCEAGSKLKWHMNTWMQQPCSGLQMLVLPNNVHWIEIHRYASSLAVCRIMNTSRHWVVVM